jgi:UDP-glucose 4-epimerase
LLIELNGAGSFELVPFPPERKAIDIGDFYADFSRIRRELGWEPQVSLREGLSKSLAFYRAQRRYYW